MTDKKTYTPGAIASFFETHSNNSEVLKEQSQLRALFDGPKETKLKKQKAVISTESPKICKKSKGADGTVERSQISNSEKMTKIQKHDGVKNIQNDKKPKKRPALELETASTSPNHELKRFKEDTSSSQDNSAVNPEAESKDEARKLSKNELNAKRRVDFKLKKEILKEQKSKNERTVFVGNVALTVTKKVLIRLFKQFGKVEAVRIRSVPVAAPVADKDDSKKYDKTRKKLGKKSENEGMLSMNDLNNAEEEEEDKTKKPKKLPKRALVIMKEFDPKRHSMNAYIVFENEESAQQSLQLNGTELEGLHIRVDMAGTAKKQDHKSTIFVGNLPFNVEEEDVRKHFDVCGEIENVRIVRDKFTGSGKGFGYVKFAEKSSCNLALSIDGQELLGRPLRIKKAAKKLKTKTVAPASKGFSTKKTKFTNTNQRRRNTKQETRKQLNSDKSAKDFKIKTDTRTQNRSKKPAQKFGDVKHRLQSMKMNTKGSRKEKHDLKKAMRVMIRERKKTSLGKMLTGGKNCQTKV